MLLDDGGPILLDEDVVPMLLGKAPCGRAMLFANESGEASPESVGECFAKAVGRGPSPMNKARCVLCPSNGGGGGGRAGHFALKPWGRTGSSGGGGFGMHLAFKTKSEEAESGVGVSIVTSPDSSMPPSPSVSAPSSRRLFAG